MRNIIAILLLAACSVLSSQAANQYVVVVELTGNPVDGNTLVVDGTTKTFKATVTSPSTQIQIGASAADTAAQIVAHYESYPLSGVYVFGDPVDTTKVYMAANEIDFVMTASMTGAWGTATVSITSLDTFTLQLPLSGLPAEQHRTNMANYLVLAMRDYSDTNFPATAGVLVHFVNKTETQTITGAKTLQNVANLFDGGRATNWTGAQIAEAWLGSLSISGAVGLTNNAPVVFLRDANASADEKNVEITLSGGEFSINYWNDASNAFNTAFQILRTGTTIDSVFFGAPINVSGAATVSGALTAGSVISQNISGAITNAYIGAHTIWSSNVWLGTGSGNHFAITNAAPAFRFYENDASEDNRFWDWVIADGVMSLRVRSDDGASGSTVMQITRDGFAGGDVQFIGDLVALGGFSAVSGVFSGALEANTGLIGYTATPYLHLTNTTSLGSDPTLGAILFALSGAARYREVGSGLDHYLHNASVEYVGAGTDHSFVGTAYTQMAFGSGGNVISLPSAGTYTIWADLAVEAGGVANETFAAKFYNVTAGADIVSSERQISNIPASRRGQLVLNRTITVSTATTIHVYVRNISSAAGAIDSVETKLGYTRHY